MAVGFFEVLSALFGWVYTLCWSLSFYPQPLLNFKRKSTSGTTVDFPLINCLGFLSYLISNLAFYCSPVVRAQYAARHDGHTPAVALNDIVFAAHALLLSLVTTSQYLFPGSWGFTPSAGNRPSRFITGTALGCTAGVLAVVVLIAGVSESPSGSVGAATSWCWLDAVYAVGYVKLWITLIKYTPQVVANFRNKSTAGWSIRQILLDFSGGVLSIAQLVIDSSLQGDWSGVTGNPVKFALGNVSMLYDLVFFAQHYVLYRGHDGGKNGEREALLENGETHGRID
ncbi:lysosomal cystine transporter [Diaporthe helianthi]|uniref:Lysosomal cystine transporter n=1 Tax=Diaporthe helianthi TaxID=158607 RepID=A0A2P5IAD0_DIAHE|nr:lysosomal cystine transporter [Diaporthe helianthi]